MTAAFFRASLRPALAAAAAAVAFAAAPSASAANLDAFYVGNSLTQDTLQDNDFGRVSLPNLAAANDNTATVGRHIKFNQSLEFIWGAPDDVDVTAAPYGTYTTGLPDFDWDAVVVQPYYDPDIAAPTASTLGTDLARIQDFVTLTRSAGRNADTRFYVLETWPRGFGANYATFWEETGSTPRTTDSPDTPTARSRPYFDLLSERLAADPDLPRITSIPVGEVLFDLIALANDGQLGDYTAASFYRDDIHLSAETAAGTNQDGTYTGIGRYVAALTNYAVIFGEELEGDSVFGLDAESGDLVDPAIAQQIRRVIDSNVAEVIPEPASAIALLAAAPALLRRRRAAA